MSFNASYDPYFADIAAPAAFETLTVVSMLGAFHFLWIGRTAWFLFFAVLSYLCRPTGLLVLGLAGVATLIAAPDRCQPWLKRIAAAVVVCLIVTVFYNEIHVASIAPNSTTGYPFRSLISRFRFIRIDDLSRFVWVISPSGVLPFFSLFLFRWQDLYARFVALVALSYFVVFYFPAFVGLHHFVPVMIMPLVVFWRTYLRQKDRIGALLGRRIPLAAVVSLGVVALWLSMPRHFEVNRTLRDIGQKLDFRVGDYDKTYSIQVQHAELLFHFIPPDWEVKEPSKVLVSGFCSVIYYSTRPKQTSSHINYVVQSLYGPHMEGFSKVADDGQAALYVKDLAEWRLDRTQPPRTDYRSALYDIPRATLFRHWGEPKGEYTIDVKQVILTMQELTGFDIPGIDS